MFKNKRLRSLLQIALSLVLLSYLMWRANPGEVIKELATINWAWYLPAFFLFIVNLFIRAYRWYILLHTLNKRPSFLYLVYLYFIGFFANNFIPSGFGGDVIKIGSLRQTYGRGAEALSSVLMDRLTGLLGSALIALAALIWNSLSHTTEIELPSALWLAIFILSVGIPAAFILLRWLSPLNWITKQFPSIKKVPKFEKVEELAETVQRYPMGAVSRSLLTSLPFTLILIMIQYSIARAMGVNLPIAVFSLFVPIISVINLLPISFNGLGIREGIYISLFVPIGVERTIAIAMSLAFYFVRFTAGLIGGVVYAARNLLSMSGKPSAENL